MLCNGLGWNTRSEVPEISHQFYADVNIGSGIHCEFFKNLYSKMQISLHF